MPASRLLFDESTIRRALLRIAHQISEENEKTTDAVVIGVQQKGAWMAESLRRILERIWSHGVPQGTLDVAMYRDDLSNKPAPTIQPTQIPGDISGKTIILVDDVIQSGRTIRAALNALNDYGRPARVQLAVLLDRGNRQLPITPNFVGRTVQIEADERITLKLMAEPDEFAVYVDPQ